jgi:signal transduction histidine kinase
MNDSLQARENALVESEELLLKAEKEKNELLEKTLVTKDEFITLISHEFKTPINVIYSAVQLIESVYFNTLPNRVKELIGNIKQNTYRQIRLSNNLLDITTLNSGQYKFYTRNIDIILLTKAIADSVESYLNPKDIEISFKSNVEHKIISIDDGKYERIILNLLSNAAKFTDYGGRISIDLNVNDELNIMQIQVNDTGIGIPKDKQKLIFENFTQVDRNLSRPAEGTGVGLSLVKLLVNILGGTIELESEKNIGSKFIVTLPIKKVEQENENEDLLDIDDRILSKVKVEFSDIYF